MEFVANFYLMEAAEEKQIKTKSIPGSEQDAVLMDEDDKDLEAKLD